MSKGVTVTMTELLEVFDDERATARFVRFLVAEGVIPPPRGGRANADYGEDHVRGVRRYLQLRDLGLTATRTKEILGGTAADAVPVPLGPGLTLVVDQDKLTERLCPKTIADRIEAAVDLIKPKDV